MSLERSANRSEDENTDMVGYLRNGYPHLLELIFGQLVSFETFLDMQGVSRWEAALLPVWKTHWQRHMKDHGWRALSSRIEHRDPALVKHATCRDTTDYRDLCVRISDSFWQIKKNIENGSSQKSQAAIIDIFKDPDDSFSVQNVVLNHQHIFAVLSTVGGWKIKMFNRWTLTPLSSRNFKSTIGNLQLNRHVVVFQCGWGSSSYLEVLDVNTLKHLETIYRGSIVLPPHIQDNGSCFFLTEDQLYYFQLVHDNSRHICHAFVGVLRLHPYKGRFAEVETFSFSYKSQHPHYDPRIYVDDKYLILDSFEENEDRYRHVQARCVKTAKLVRQHHFRRHDAIEREYKNGIIMALAQVNYFRFIVAWDVHNNRVEGVIHHAVSISSHVISASMNHFPEYQMVYCKHRCKMQIISKETKDSSKSKLWSKIRWLGTKKYFNFDPSGSIALERILYCDGIQVIGTSRLGEKLIVLDLI